jgi:F-type H+-transporting ATPase subunit b
MFLVKQLIIRRPIDKESNAKMEQDEFKKKNKEFAQKKKERMDKVVLGTYEERYILMEITRNEATEMHIKLQKFLSEIQENLNRVIAEITQQEVFFITRKTIADITSQSLEAQSISIFINRSYKSGRNMILRTTSTKTIPN